MTLVLLCPMTSEDIKTQESKTLGLCVCVLLLKELDNVLFSSNDDTTGHASAAYHGWITTIAVESSVATSMSVQCCATTCRAHVIVIQVLLMRQ